MKEEILSAIEDHLFSLNINAEIESDQIIWKDNFGAENYIIHYDKYQDNLAWWKSNKVGKDLLVFSKDNFLVSWKPPLNNMGMTFGCNYLKYYQEKIIVAYPDKHVERVFVLNTSNLQADEIYISYSLAIAVKDSVIYIKDLDKDKYLSFNIENTSEKKILCEEDFKKLSLSLKKRWGSEEF